MTTPPPENVVRTVLPTDFRKLPRHWLIDGVVAKSEVTAIAAASAKDRLALGTAILRGTLQDREALSRPVHTHVRNAVVLATSRPTAEGYREQFVRDERLVVAQLVPWEPSDSSYLSELGSWAQGFGLVVVDCLQDVPTTTTSATLSALARVCPTLVALIRGNETKAGVGGAAIWDAADQRFWLDPKSQLCPVDSHSLTEPWPVDLRLDDIPNF